MEDIKGIKAKHHNITLESREKLNISGVTDVGSFDESNVIVSTQMGELVIKGEDLRISSLDVNDGNVSIKGLVHSIAYESKGAYKNERGFFKSLFK
ncbi:MULTISPECIES: sporulation protein YabP [Lutispora]|uniref:Sporulation protein YabP n=1 Tax=Lutispora saccharofermentans TaxID=3024236 RepID=A0ABT1NHE0_9FIRM|nr:MULTISPECIES: sporulation protein YabP [Lutispora]MCQ1530591.1 sporulation protein YabP [Lutispora saccharofermentans]MEA4961288.1 sporulation protein YabP [Lutispora sp.]HCJ56878.1 sporulation protein YabP [Clostridiaceae bacterium]